MSRPLLVDLFCKAGGAGAGYHRAGFDVLGVDIEPQPRYPFPFVQADAFHFMTIAVDSGLRFAAVHASPPCRDHIGRKLGGEPSGTGWMLPAIRERLAAQAQPWIIENVPGAPMRADYKLCGCMFGLPGLRRERWFETSWHAFEMRPPCHHTGHAITVTGNAGGWSNRDQLDMGDKAARSAAMGIDWMTNAELSQAIPPAYTEHIGRMLLDHIAAVTT